MRIAVILLLLLGTVWLPTLSASPNEAKRVYRSGAVATPSAVVVEGAPADSKRPGTAMKAIALVGQKLVELINQVRLSHTELNGTQLPPLKREEVLDQVAEAHSLRMATAGFVGHCDPDETSLPGDRLSTAGYLADLAGESLVAGYFDPAQVLDALLLSPGNRLLVLSPELREIGIGFVPDLADQADVGDGGGR